jgi:hypothetical protein
MKKILSLSFSILIGISVLAQKEDIKAIKNVYATYNKATANKNAEEALHCLTTSSVDYYSQLLTFSKTADSVSLANLPIVDMLMTLTIKARTEASLLCSMNTGEELLLQALREGMTGDINPIKEITVEGDTAYATVKDTTALVSHKFIKESTGWKIDLTYSFSVLSQRLETITQEYQLPKQLLCIATLKRASIEIPETIWKPACK